MDFRCLQWEQHTQGNKEVMLGGTKKKCKESDGQVMCVLYMKRNKVIKRAVFLKVR